MAQGFAYPSSQLDACVTAATGIKYSSTALTVAAKRPGFLRRVLAKSTTVLCAVGGAGIGAIWGVSGAIVGAGGGGVDLDHLCAVHAGVDAESGESVGLSADGDGAGQGV